MRLFKPVFELKKDRKKVSGKHRGIFFILALIIALASPYQLRAEEVASLDDEGDGSLRQLVAGATITFSQAGTITLTSPITIDKNIVIVGQINN